MNWISVNDYVPDCSEPVLVYSTGCVISKATIGCYYEAENNHPASWIYYDIDGSNDGDNCITHWMPLPDSL